MSRYLRAERRSFRRPFQRSLEAIGVFAALLFIVAPAANSQPRDTPPVLKIGSKAPDFTLMNQDREPVSLSGERGHPVVLAFFPAAFSGTCTKEMCTFRDSMSELNRMSASVLGVSTDTFFALKAWADAQHLTFPLLSDYNKTVINQYGVVNPDMIGLKNIARRATFVIDRGGIIRHSEVLEDARNEPDYEKVRGALAGVR